MEKSDMQRVSICPDCGTLFNCENCKRLEKHKLQYFGKGTVRNADSRIG